MNGLLVTGAVNLCTAFRWPGLQGYSRPFGGRGCKAMDGRSVTGASGLCWTSRTFGCKAAEPLNLVSVESGYLDRVNLGGFMSRRCKFPSAQWEGGGGGDTHSERPPGTESTQALI